VSRSIRPTIGVVLDAAAAHLGKLRRADPVGGIAGLTDRRPIRPHSGLAGVVDAKRCGILDERRYCAAQV